MRQRLVAGQPRRASPVALATVLALLMVALVVAPANAAPLSQGFVFVTRWGSDVTSDGKLNLPRGVAVDASSNIYVADTDNHRIQVFGPATPLPVPGVSGPGLGALAGALAVLFAWAQWRLRRAGQGSA